MDWGKFIYFLGFIFLAYLPYKLIQRSRTGGLSTISKRVSLLLSSWFIALSLVLLREIPNEFFAFSRWPLLFLTNTSILWLLSPWIMRNVGRYPTNHIRQNPISFIVLFEPRTLYLKYIEVVFQQVVFLYLLFVVLANLSSDAQISWFAFIVSLIHLLNYLVLPSKVTFLFFVISIPMGIAFGYLIFHGLVLITTSLHLWFYLILAAFPWFDKQHKADSID